MVLANIKISYIFKYGILVFWYHFVDLLSLIQNLYKYTYSTYTSKKVTKKILSKFYHVKIAKPKNTITLVRKLKIEKFKIS